MDTAATSTRRANRTRIRLPLLAEGPDRDRAGNGASELVGQGGTPAVCRCVLGEEQGRGPAAGAGDRGGSERGRPDRGYGRGGGGDAGRLGRERGGRSG